MREMTKFFLAAIAALVLAGPVACAGGDDDDDDTVDANGGGVDAPPGTIDAPPGTIDAPPAAGGWYAACGSVNGPCPEETPALACTGLEGVGSATDGWCAPPCANNHADCTTNYTGPGTPQCLLGAPGADPNLCVVVCTGAGGECPAGLSCVDTGQGAWICTVPA